MNFIKKYWILTFVILAIAIDFLVIDPLEKKKDLFSDFSHDLMRKWDGRIEEIDQNKYCTLLSEISKNKSTSCEDNLEYWIQKEIDFRIKINKGLHPKYELFEVEENLSEKIDMFKRFPQGLIFISIVILFFRRLKPAE